MSQESKERMNSDGVRKGFMCMCVLVCMDEGNMTTSEILMLSRGGVLQINSKLSISMKCVFSQLRSQRIPFLNRYQINTALEQTVILCPT